MGLFLQDEFSTFVYNKELKTILVIFAGKIAPYRQKETSTGTDWEIQETLYDQLVDLTKAQREHLRNHVSTNGKYYIVCNSGIKIYELVSENKDGEENLKIKLTDWTLPIRTDGLEDKDLASRVKFESNSVLRFLTPDNRDILYGLDEDGKQVHYISEVKVDNLLVTNEHKIA